MTIVGTKHLQIVRAQFQIGSMGIMNSSGLVSVKEKFRNGEMKMFIPAKAAKKLRANDVVDALGALSPDGKTILHVFVLARDRMTDVADILYSAGETWNEMYVSLNPSLKALAVGS